MHCRSGIQCPAVYHHLISCVVDLRKGFDGLELASVAPITNLTIASVPKRHDEDPDDDDGSASDADARDILSCHESSDKTRYTSKVYGCRGSVEAAISHL